MVRLPKSPLVLLLALLAMGLVTGCDSHDQTPGPPPRVVRVDQAPAWSPDGSRIVYLHDARWTADTTDVTGLYVLDLEADTTGLVIDGLATSPDWRPDGERIAFAAGDIYTIRPDGSDLEQVSAFGSSFHPRWSTDGQTISFGRSGTQAQVGIWFATLFDSTFTRFGFGATPADWAPDGQRIVYNLRDQLWIADTSRTDSTQLTDNDFVENRTPAWSPDGEWIAWSPLTGDGRFELWAMRADGSEKQRLADNAREPAWGPDSERIVFAKPAPGNRLTALWTVRRDGSGLRQITDPARNPLN